MAVYGLHIMAPISWGWAAFVWGYAIIWALVTDPIKLLAYRIFDPATRPETPKRPANVQPKAAPVPS